MSPEGVQDSAEPEMSVLPFLLLGYVRPRRPFRLGVILRVSYSPAQEASLPKSNPVGSAPQIETL